MKRFLGRMRQMFVNRLVLLLLGVLVFVGVFALNVVHMNLYNLVKEYIDIPLLLWLVLLFVFVMCVTGVWKDFINGFRLAFAKRKGITRMELQKAANAMKIASKILIIESVIAVAISIVDLLYFMGFYMVMSQVGPLLSLLLLSTAYIGLFSLIVIPLQIRLENMAISYMEETREESEQDIQQDAQTIYFRLRAMGLTDREAEVARLVCNGLSNKEIGQALYISDTTVKKHMTHILEKTGGGSREVLMELVKEGG